MKIEFVSYTGKYPNLCSGMLTLRINGEEVRFGDNYRWNDTTCEYEYIDDIYDKFWCSGGNCGFTNGYANSYVNTASWKIDRDKLPEKYREYADEIAKVFNDNVDWGCCGGCL